MLQSFQKIYHDGKNNHPTSSDFVILLISELINVMYGSQS